MSNKKILLFVAGLTGLLALQIKVLQPLLFDVASSDFFLVETHDQANVLPINNDMTTLAFMHCNSYINSNLSPGNSASFADSPTFVFGEGNYSYIIKSEVNLTINNTPSQLYHYACKIQYELGDELSGVGNIENWSIQGIDGLPEL